MKVGRRRYEQSLFLFSSLLPWLSSVWGTVSAIKGQMKKENRPTSSNCYVTLGDSSRPAPEAQQVFHYLEGRLHERIWSLPRQPQALHCHLLQVSWLIPCVGQHGQSWAIMPRDGTKCLLVACERDLNIGQSPLRMHVP
jgi:hypothetical protein